MDTPSSGTVTPVDVENGVNGIRKRLTITFRDLNVRVTAPDAALGSTLWSRVDPRQLAGFFKRDQRHKRVQLEPRYHYHGSILTKISDYLKGCFWPGEARRDGKSCRNLLEELPKLIK